MSDWQLGQRVDVDGAGSEVAGQIGEGHCQDWIYNKGWADEQVNVWVWVDVWAWVDVWV